MHSISLAIVGVLLTITLCPYTIHATTTETAELEEPKILPLTDAKAASTDPKLGYSELWQEDDREVLIRNERGAKDNNGQGTTTGKKQNKKDKNQNMKNVQKQHQQHLNSKSPDTNLDSLSILNNTQENHQQQSHQSTVKKHQQKHEKNSNKKHVTTEKPNQKDENSCRYTKGAWTECDSKTNTRSRTLTLKKGEGSCVPSRTIQKKCKNKSKPEKACRYEKGTWGECQLPSGEMTRLDKLKSTSDSATCAPTRTMNKKCNKSKQDKQNKQRTKEKKQNDRKNRQ